MRERCVTCDVRQNLIGVNPMRHLPAPPIAPATLPPASPIEPADDAGDRSATSPSRGAAPNPPALIDHESARTRQQIRRILWIDDEFDRDNALVRLLEFEGFRIEVEGSGAEGLAKARAGAYDGIVLDLRLPDMFGLSVLKRLVADDDPRPVLVVTGYYHEPEMESEAMAAGAAAFRHKPLITSRMSQPFCTRWRYHPPSRKPRGTVRHHSSGSSSLKAKSQALQP